MRLLIDARKITDGGIGRYTQSLIDALLSNRPEISITALVLAHQRERLPQAVLPLVTDLRPYSLKSFLFLARQIPWQLFDLFHSPHFFLPRWSERNPPIPTVVTVHDLIPITHPHNALHQRMMSYLLDRLRVQASADPSVITITVSAASQRALRELVGIEATVVPNILPDKLWPPLASGERVPGDYALCVLSNDKPHKGAFVFAEACRLAGVRGVAVGLGARSLIGLPGIEVIPEVPWSDLRTLYIGARMLVVASRVEGFCLPAMEAKALGVPVVASPDPAVCELLDEHDQLATDFSAVSLAQAMSAALAQPGQLPGVSSSAAGSYQYSYQSGYQWSSGSRFLAPTVAKSLLTVYHLALR